MFVLRNKFGNVYYQVNNEREKQILLNEGCILVEEQPKKVNLDKMKVSELEALAESKGIDLSDCRNREDKLTKN